MTKRLLMAMVIVLMIGCHEKAGDKNNYCDCGDFGFLKITAHADGEPVPSALVLVSGKSFLTNDIGYVSTPLIEFDGHEIAITLSGYEPYLASVNIKCGEITDIRVDLEKIEN